MQAEKYYSMVWKTENHKNSNERVLEICSSILSLSAQV